MVWTSSKNADAKNRIKQFDKDRLFVPNKQGQTIPKIENMRLGEAKEFNLAVMHVDMNNFKGLTGSLTNEQKLRFLNIYLSEFTHMIREYDGFVEKYVGDSITALFGVGKDDQQSCLDAVHCGLSMLTEVYYAMNTYLDSIGLPKFSCSIGIDFGSIWVARVGVQGMNQLTLVGNEVSIAKQIEEFAGNHQIFVGGGAYLNLNKHEQAICKIQNQRSDFNWTWFQGKKYPFYHYTAHWEGFDL
ncbi:hypothetical protein C5F49_05175 [Nitrosopumilus oxyclinae]|uniref:Guanylate cyclase domain-containing protein n=1 Tax=Nitrosopumilus oxyclinae TaxID=1959104 RepID=A0A7D5M216_9ARCH|nr:adenylate/guanylate cyclase domain-containing protein [Nitrosopumilus oxyclinae]QLH04772.1 hypothetical protein C5F49_05175 [Nitrosopumilus oxyclinae]